MALTVKVGQPNEVFNITQRSNTLFNLKNWPDGHLSRVVVTPVTQYRWIGSSGGAEGMSVGSLYNLAAPGPSGGSGHRDIEGVPSVFGYAGGGSVVQNPDPKDKTLIMTVHVERYFPHPDFPNDSSKHITYTQLGLAKSIDYGLTWRWLDLIIRPSLNTPPAEIAGGSLVFAGQFLYCIYREVIPANNDSGQIGYPSIAVAPYQSVFDNAKLGFVDAYDPRTQTRVSPWKKFSGWVNGKPKFDRQARTDANGTAAAGAALVGLPFNSQYNDKPLARSFNFDWCDVAVVNAAGNASTLGYLMAFAPIGGSSPEQVYLATSTDLLNWDLYQGLKNNYPVSITDDHEAARHHYYPSLVFPNGNNHIGPGTDVQLYYVSSTTAIGVPITGWASASVFRRHIVVTGS